MSKNLLTTLALRASRKAALRGLSLAVLGLLAVLLLPCRLTAQIDTGGITGTVTDSTGAVVVGARITLTNDATNVKIAAVSTSTGTYSLGGLLPGTYTIKAEATGFKGYVVHGLEVHVQKVLTLDIPFAPGNVSQSVTVTAAAPLLEAENAAVGQTINNQAVSDMPLVTRDWGALSQLAAGVTTAPPGQPTADSGTTAAAYFSVNGGNVWQNDFRLNGINDNIEIYGGNYTGTNAAIVPPPDAVQEFKVQNGDFSAEFGHSTGGVINAALKSGTNKFHGDLWEYVRNDIFNAACYFCGGSTPEYRQNLFGVTIGGPVVKNKTFFFFDYQGGRFITPADYGSSTVPTKNMANSGFTNLQDAIQSGATSFGTDALNRKFQYGTILDPATTRQLPGNGFDAITGLTGTPNGWVRDPFYNCTAAGCPVFLSNATDYTTPTQLAKVNIIPTSRLDTNAVKLLGVYPAPTASGYLNNYTMVPNYNKSTNTWDVRIDEIINPKNIVFGVFDRSLFTRVVPSQLPGLAVGQNGGRNDSLPAYAWAGGYTHIFTPTLTNVMHVGMVHSDKLQQSFYGNTFGIPAQYGIQGIQQVADNGGLPPITIGNNNGNFPTNLGVGGWTPTMQYVWSIEGADAVTKLYRSHTFNIGIQVDDLEGNISQPPQGRGNFNFSGQFTDIPNQTNWGSGAGSFTGLGDILVTPIPSTVGGVNYVGGMNEFYGTDIAATDDHRWYWGAFFQDDWKVTPKLTVNLGLRWDYFTPYAEINGRQANFIPNGGNGSTGTYYMSRKGCAVARSTAFNTLIAASGITLDCVGGLALGDAQKTNFAPRVGFAYRLTPKVVVRGGFGTAYGALGNLGYGGTLGTNYPFVYEVTYDAPDSQHPYLFSASHPATMETAFTNINLQDPTILAGTGLNLYGRQYSYQTPYVETQNLTVQDQFTTHDALQIGYVGSAGRHLDNLGYNNSPTQILPPGYNPQLYVPFPAFSRNATYETTNGSSHYNSLQATYEHQMSAGLTLLANYTYSKCMSDQHTQASQNQGYRAEWLPGFGIKKDYAVCDTDATQIVHVSGAYNLPFGRGRALMSDDNKATDAIVGGWILSFIYSHQTGQPFTVNCANTTTADFGCFANVVPGQSLYAGPHNATQWLNPNAFADPPVATMVGQTDYSPLGGGQEQARGPGYKNLDAAILKNFQVTDSFRFQFRAEAFNVTNTPPFAQPGQLNYHSSGFSNISSTKNSNGNNGARTLQIALKLFF